MLNIMNMLYRWKIEQQGYADVLHIIKMASFVSESYINLYKPFVKLQKPCNLHCINKSFSIPGFDNFRAPFVTFNYVNCNFKGNK
jgi:hypothetical protein